MIEKNCEVQTGRKLNFETTGKEGTLCLGARIGSSPKNLLWQLDCKMEMLQQGWAPQS